MVAPGKSKAALDDALARFETCLETPVVPGELPDWCASASDTCAQMSTCLRREIDEAHPPIYRQILREDAEMAARVEALEQVDDDLLVQLENVSERLARLRAAANAVEPHESRLDEQLQDAVDAGLALVLAARKQETAITTWYCEALERDRGDVD